MKKDYKKEILLLVIFLFVCGNFFVWKQVWGIGDELKVVFFDIGQGDSAFIETPEGHQILIDGGPSGKRLLGKLSKEMPFWDKTIDLIVLTHPDSDHLTGLNYVLDRYKVENILWTGVLKETKTFQTWLDKIEQENANIVIASVGKEIQAGEAKFFVLYPFESLDGELREKDSNDGSIVLKLLFGKNSFLFTGDISAKIEKQFLPRSALPVGLGADVLKVSHHGSKNASSKEFLGIVAPEIAVISCGENNSYGHPHPDVLNNLQDFGILVLRTDESGDIKIFSNGISYFQN